MPGAASLAHTASTVARALRGEPAAQPRHAIGALCAQGDAAPAGPVLITVIPVGVAAVGEFVGQPGQLFGAKPGAFLAGVASAQWRVGASTQPGSRWENRRITPIWPVPNVPARWAAALAANTGASGWPVSARRGPTRRPRRCGGRALRRLKPQWHK